MARHKAAPYHLRSKDGRAILDFSTPGGARSKTALGVPYDPKRSSPAERRAALEAAEERYRELTDGRVVEEHARVATSLNFQELYALYIDKWEPPDGADVNARQKMLKALGVRRSYGTNVMSWASDEATRPDGSKRWRGDKRTPLERLLANGGADEFLAWRLENVVRKSMKKEKSNLCLFFTWLKTHRYIKSVPPVTLPAGAGKKALVNGRGVHIPMTPLQAAQIVALLPVWSSRPTRRKFGGEAHEHRAKFLVRPFFEFMSMTGLREATIERLEVPRSWRRGQTTLALDDADDKAQYGRAFPLTPAAVALLEQHAPEAGHIFGHHDFRKHLKAAAAIVFKDEPTKAKIFGGYHFRHFVGTLLANAAGTKLPAASYVMGHTDLSTTSVYVHAAEADARKLLEKVEKERLKAAKTAATWASRRPSAPDEPTLVRPRQSKKKATEKAA